jgi:hypothetical protein
MKKIIRKSDIVLFIILVLIGTVLSLSALHAKTPGKTVVIKVDGELYGRYPLSEDREISINRDKYRNHISIKGGKVQMTESNCPNHFCLKQGAISEANTGIVCLPNRVMVEIEGEDGDYDVLSE